MSTNSPNYVPIEIVRYIQSTAESENNDSKGPMAWDGKAASAGLAKDIAAFANSRDGGVIIIGKREIRSGQFELDGLSDEQADSFDTTKVCTWINNYFDPPIHLVCHRQELDGKTFIVITINEFDDVPHICKKLLPNENDKNKPILKEGTIYVRTQNAESKPLQTTAELRSLIGLATRKRGNELLKIFDSALKGRPLHGPQEGKSPFEEELEQLKPTVDDAIRDETGWFQVIARPSNYIRERWEDANSLIEIVKRRSVNLREQFPAYRTGTQPFNLGLFNGTYGDVWTLTRSGMFFLKCPFWENHEEYTLPWRTISGNTAQVKIPPGKWVDFKSSIFRLTEVFVFLARFSEEFEVGESMLLDVSSNGLVGRKLVTVEFGINVRDREPALSDFQFKTEATIEEFRANWESYCIKAMRRFLELFGSEQIDSKVLQDWITRFQNRNF